MPQRQIHNLHNRLHAHNSRLNSERRILNIRRKLKEKDERRKEFVYILKKRIPEDTILKMEKEIKIVLQDDEMTIESVMM